MKKVLAIFLCLAALVTPVIAVSPGDTFGDEQGLVYEVTGASAVSVAGYDGTAPNVIIPSVAQASDGGNIYKFYVTSIGYEAFKENQVIESVVIPKTVTVINMYAFYGCRMLYRVHFEEDSQLEEIKDYAFHYCSGLIDINIPARKITQYGDTEILPHVREKAFNKEVPNITYPLTFQDERKAPKGYTNNFGALHMNCLVGGYLIYPQTDTEHTNVMLCSSAAKGAIVVPESVTTISSPGFQNCSHITALSLPENLSTVGSRIFCGCSSLTSIVSKCVTPPVSPYYLDDLPEFVDVNKDIPVYVPKNSISAYSNAKGWDQFTNYQELTEETEEQFQYTLTVQAEDASMGSVTGTGTYEGGSDAVIEAIPNSGFEFVRWNDNETANPRTVKMTQDTTFTAIFQETQAVTYTLTLAVNDAKMGVVTGGGTYAEGATANIAAVALGDYEFKKWSDGNTEAIRSIVMTKDLTLTAIFGAKELPKFTVTLAVNDEKMGSVEGAGTYEQGTKVTIKAVAKEGFQFVQWSDNNKEAIREIEVTQDISLTATFEALPEVQFTITVSANDPTMGSVLGGGVYGQNASVTILAIPNEGFRFVQWNDEVKDATRTFVATADAAFVAFFEKAEGIESVQDSEVRIQKIVIDGQLYIMNEGKIYDVQGNRVK